MEKHKKTQKNKYNELIYSKKGLEAYIGWVLLLGISLIISVFMYSWINTQVQSSTQSIEQKSDTSVCDDVGITLTNICQNTQTLNMNITNSKLLKITSLVFRFYDLYDNQDGRSFNVTIRPKDTEHIEIIKQGTLKQVEIIPIIKQDNKIITCKKSMITLQYIQYCD